MTRDHWAIFLEDEAGEESARFHVEASSALIACTRAATRLFGPESEQRRVYACAMCGAELWEGERLDSSGFRFCADCEPSSLEGREEQEPVGLVAGKSRLRAALLAPLPGDVPLGSVTVLVPDPRERLERGENVEVDEAQIRLTRELRGADMSDEILGDLTVRDETGAFFRYETRLVTAPVDAQELIDKGVIEAEEGELRAPTEGGDEGADDGDEDEEEEDEDD